MRCGEDCAIGAVSERAIDSASSPVSTAKPAGRRRSRSKLCAASAEQSLMPMIAGSSASEQRLIAEVDAGAVGDVVEDDRLCRGSGECCEMPAQPLLRGPRVIGAGDEVSRDRPIGCGVEPALQGPRVAAGEAEIDRPVAAQRACGNADQPPGLLGVEHEALAGGGGEDEAVERRRGIMR